MIEETNERLVLMKKPPPDSSVPKMPDVFPPIKPEVWQEILECKKLTAEMGKLSAEAEKHIPLAAGCAMTALVVTHGFKAIEINDEQTELTIILGNGQKLVFGVNDVNNAWITYSDKVYDSDSDPALTENQKRHQALNAEFERRRAKIPESDWHASIFGKRC